MKNKGRFLKKYRGEECLNCGVPLDIIDRYCHNCGQINTTKKLSFRDFFNEFFASIFSYDSRLRHSLIAMLFMPGKISKEYTQGKRVKYVNPFRFYLSVSILFFIITGLLTDFGEINFGDNTKKGELGIIRTDIEDALKEDLKGAKRQIDSLEKAIENQNIPDTLKNISKEKLKALKTEVSLDSLEDADITNIKDIIDVAIKREKKKTYKDKYLSESELQELGGFENLRKRFSLYKSFFKETNIKNHNTALDSLQHTKTKYHKWIYDKALQIEDFKESSQGIVSFFISKLPFIIFFLLPVFAIVNWVLYIRNKFSYMEHLIFLFHTQTMFFFLLALGILLDNIFFNSTDEGSFSKFTILIFLFYLYKAMRKFYEQGRFKTLVKFTALNLIFSILAVIGLLFGFIISFALY